MRFLLLAIVAPLALGGCISTRTVDTPSAAPSTQTLIIPPSAAPAPIVVCANGMQPPCP